MEVPLTDLTDDAVQGSGAESSDNNEDEVRMAKEITALEKNLSQRISPPTKGRSLLVGDLFDDSATVDSASIYSDARSRISQLSIMASIGSDYSNDSQSNGTFASASSMFSDMEHLRSLMRGDMEVDSVEDEAVKLLKEAAARIQAEEHALVVLKEAQQKRMAEAENLNLSTVEEEEESDSDGDTMSGAFMDMSAEIVNDFQLRIRMEE